MTTTRPWKSGLRPPLPKGNQLFELRVLLLDEQRRLLAGQAEPWPQPPYFLPLKAGNRTIGFLGLIPPRLLADSRIQQFVREQNRSLMTIALTIAALAALLASGLILDEPAMRARLDGRNLDLTAVEFKLLALLASRPGHIYNRDQRIECIYPDQRIVNDRTIDSHIKKLRRKMELTAPGRDLIHSVYGVGYKYESDGA